MVFIIVIKNIYFTYCFIPIIMTMIKKVQHKFIPLPI